MTFLIGAAIATFLISTWRIGTAVNKLANGMSVLAAIHLAMAKYPERPGELAHAAHKIEVALGVAEEQAL